MMQMYYYHFTSTRKRNIKSIHLTSFSNTIVLHHGNKCNFVEKLIAYLYDRQTYYQRNDEEIWHFS